jgi:predicted flavoprotein YhiN
MSLIKYPCIHVIGEALDINGDTGGYNLQFAYSSARAAI